MPFYGLFILRNWMRKNSVTCSWSAAGQFIL
jgi:hypothetical protein